MKSSMVSSNGIQTKNSEISQQSELWINTRITGHSSNEIKSPAFKCTANIIISRRLCEKEYFIFKPRISQNIHRIYVNDGNSFFLFWFTIKLNAIVLNAMPVDVS